MKAAHWGVLAFVGFSAIWMGGAALLWGGSVGRGQSLQPSSTGKAATATASQRPAAVSPLAATSLSVQAATKPRVENLVQRLVDLLLGRAVQDEDELGRVERELLELGEQAVGPLVAQLRREQDPAGHDRLLDFLRKLPGSAAEQYLIEEARQGARGTTRTLAIDALAERRTDVALAALDQIAKTDPDLPSRPFIAEPRLPDDDSTELPDEVTFTPRMKAMAALASTQDARVTPMLADILRHDADESLRMEAARNLAKLRGDAAALDALLAGLGDSSPYVRLAALHSLEGVDESRVRSALIQLLTREPDHGVALLARRLLTRFTSTQ
jgi:hypothetical protein